jgi:hypothetical protein
MGCIRDYNDVAHRIWDKEGRPDRGPQNQRSAPVPTNSIPSQKVDHALRSRFGGWCASLRLDQFNRDVPNNPWGGVTKKRREWAPNLRCDATRSISSPQQRLRPTPRAAVICPRMCSPIV